MLSKMVTILKVSSERSAQIWILLQLREYTEAQKLVELHVHTTTAESDPAWVEAAGNHPILLQVYNTPMERTCITVVTKSRRSLIDQLFELENLFKTI